MPAATKEQEAEAERVKLLEEYRPMTLEEIWGACERTLRASAVAQRVMIEKFGIEEWRRFNKAIETGRIKP